MLCNESLNDLIYDAINYNSNEFSLNMKLRLFSYKDYYLSNSLNPYMLFPDAIDKAIKNYYNKIARIRTDINYLMCNAKYSYFVTLTISNEHLKSQKKIRYAKSRIYNSFKYVLLNEDYGGKEGRLHFHCVIGSEKEITDNDIQNVWKIGFTNTKLIKANNSIERYINKLSYHASKISHRYFKNFKNEVREYKSNFYEIKAYHRLLKEDQRKLTR